LACGKVYDETVDSRQSSVEDGEVDDDTVGPGQQQSIQFQRW
jgi:hypothetical protein